MTVEERMQYREFFKKNYNPNMVYLPEAQYLTNANKGAIKKAIPLFDEWYRTYLDRVETIAAEAKIKSESNVATLHGLKASTPILESIDKVTKLIVNKWFDCVVKTQMKAYADGHAYRKLRRRISEDFSKGRYITIPVARKLYFAIERIMNINN